MKNCPNCGKLLEDDAVRCACGTHQFEDAYSVASVAELTEVSRPGENKETRDEKEIKRIEREERYQLTPWNVIFVFICNLSATLVVIDVLTKGIPWSYFVVPALIFGYFVVFALSSRSAKKFFSRYRNGVLILNTVCGILCFILQDKEKLANNYFIPCNLIIAGIIFMLLLCSKEISSKTVFISMLLLTWQSFVQFFLLMFRITDTPTISIILISLAFLLNLNGSISTFVLFAKKFRRKKSEKFCWWE